MQSPRSTIEKLRRLAAGAGAEADSARMILRELESKHPDAVAELDALMPDGQAFIPCADEYERQVVARLAAYLGCEAYKIKNGPRAQWRKGLNLHGPMPFLQVAKAYAVPLLAKLRELLMATACGFSWGALPMEESETRGNAKAVEMTADQKAAARAAYGVGIGNVPRKALPAAE